MTSPANKPIIPSITGIPVLDTVLAAGMVSASTALATTIVTWANSKGFQNIDTTQVTGVLLGIFGAVATVVWRVIQSRRTQTAVADHVITAAATGVIPESVIKEAVKAPSISEARIETAVANAQTIKEQQ